MRFFRSLPLLALLALSNLAAASELAIITLKYRSAEQVIPVIRPLIAPGGSVSGMQNQLFLRTTKSNLADLRKVLASLDTLPRPLMIYVRQDAEGAGAQRLGPAHRRRWNAQERPPHLGQSGGIEVGSACYDHEISERRG
jgi:type II secretory pathway component GspD/PulD (secretin)